MRINAFVLDKTLVNTTLISLGIHLFYFSCIVFTFEDKIRYHMEPPSIDFLGSIIRSSDMFTETGVTSESFITKISDKFLNTPRQNTSTEMSYTSVKKPSFVRSNLFVRQKLSTKFVGISSTYERKESFSVQDDKVLDSNSGWGTNLKLKVNDKN